MGETGLLENGITARGAGRWLDENSELVNPVIDGLLFGEKLKPGCEFDKRVAAILAPMALKDNIKLTHRCIGNYRYKILEMKLYQKKPRATVLEIDTMGFPKHSPVQDCAEHVLDIPFKPINPPPVPAYKKMQQDWADIKVRQAIACGAEGITPTESITMQIRNELEVIIEEIAKRQQYLYPLVQVHKGNIECLKRFAFEVLHVFEINSEGGVPAQDTKA